MFDRVLVVDWSANAAPKRGADSIWIAQVDVASGRCSEPANPPTRADAREQLEAVLSQPGRTLAGFDFPLGYPAGFAAAAGLDGAAPWAATWGHLRREIADDDRNRNNRWAVAAELNRRLGTGWFWGVPPRHAGRHLGIRKPPLSVPPAEWRACERALIAMAGGNPMSCRQLLGAGSVGSQALTGIPVLAALRTHASIGERVRVWPFEAIDPAPHRIVFAEVWPSFLPSDVIDAVDHPVKDARQVTALARHLATLDREGALSAWFDRAGTPHLDAATAEQVTREEGWVLLV